jgi:histidine triad (HIT) family protein
VADETTAMTDSAAPCIFCDIVHGKRPAEWVYEDDTVVAFLDANPASPIHILVVPRRHIATLNDVPKGDPLIAHMAEVARKVAQDYGVADSGYRFFINVNRGGGQVVFHLHAHIVAGRDFGTVLIQIGITLAILWRKAFRVFHGRARQP